MEIVDALNQGWISAAIGAVGVLLTVLSLLTYRASRILARPTCQLGSRRLVGTDNQELPEGAEITFAGAHVARLSFTYVVFWNAGRKTLKNSEVVHSDPIRVEFQPGDEILKATVLRRTRTVNQFMVDVEQRKPHLARFSFDFLDQDDGATVALLHTSNQVMPRVLGTIRGVRQGVRQLKPLLKADVDSMAQGTRRARRSSLLSPWTGTALATALWIVSILFVINSAGFDTVLMLRMLPFLISGVLVFLVTGIVLSKLTGTKFPKALRMPGRE